MNKDGRALRSKSYEKVVCGNCGKAFFKKSSEIRNTHHNLCSRSCYYDWQRKRNAERVNLNPSPELSYVLGAVYSDGFILTVSTTRQTQYKISLHVKDKDFAEEFNKCVCKVLGKDRLYKIGRRPDGRFRVEALSKKLHDFIKSQSQHHQVISQYPADFIRAFADGDGCVYIYYDKRRNLEYPRIKFTNSDKDFLLYIKKLLEEKFGINTGSPYIVAEEGKTVEINGYETKATKDNFDLAINNQLDILRFNQKIGFNIKRKQEKLNKAIKVIMPRLQQRLERMRLYNEAMKIREQKGWGYLKIARELGVPEGTVNGWLYQGEKPRGKLI